MKYLMLAVLVLAGCTRPDGATRVLEANGFKDIQITGYKWFACSKDDSFATGFVATGPTGKRISGCVCEGILFKNSTIRFE
jgi:hypothetical protein